MVMQRLTIGTMLSAAMHVVIVLVMLVMGYNTAFPSYPETAIEVDIVDVLPDPPPEKPEVAARPVEALPPSTSSLPAPPPAAPPPETATVPPVAAETPSQRHPGVIRATRMLGTAALAEPRNSQIRRMLPTLAGEEQLRQLCVVEALAQIAQLEASFQPMQVISYATAPLNVVAGRLVARGAAVSSHGRWFRLAFNCVFNSARRVSRFEFELGDVIPRRQWAQYNLPAAGGVPLETATGH